MANLNGWDIVSANNNAAPPGGWPENTMQYSEVNDTGREVQGVLKRFFGDVNGSLIAGGVADAYTVTLNEAEYVAYFAGMYFACEIMATNTGATTINVNAIGVQSVVLPNGNALTGGELTSGGIYEFRYDGVNLQLMGALPSAGAFTTLDVTDPTLTDLVDTDNPLNVGAAVPASNGHLALDRTGIQSKLNGTTANVLQINEDGGTINFGANVGFGATLQTSNPGVFNLVNNIGQYRIGNNRIISYLTTGNRIQIHQGSGTSNDVRLRTGTTGVQISGTLNNAVGGSQDTKVELFNNGFTQVGSVGFQGATTMFLESLNDGGSITIRASDSVGATHNLISGDPDNNLLLYFDGINTARTVSVANGSLEILDDLSNFLPVPSFIHQIEAINLPNLAAQAVSNQDITVTGAQIGDGVVANWELTPTQALDGISILNCYVVAADLVRVNFFNFDTSAHDIVERDLALTILRIH